MHETTQAGAGSPGQPQPQDGLSEAAALDYEGEDRKLAPWLVKALAITAFSYALFHLVVLNFLAIDEWVYRVVHVNVGAVLAFLWLKGFRRERQRGIPVRDWLLAAAALGCTAYVAINLDGLLMRTGVITTTGDFICGAAGTVLVLEFARRVSGMILSLVAGIFLAYLFVGPYLPGVLHHPGYDIGNIFSYLYSQEAIFGITAAASSRYIILFVAFAVFLQACGAGDYFMRVALALVGWARGGPAKVSVVSGLLFGTVSGSAVANVVATGTFTIPMMLKVGYPKDEAGSVEATSSTGGQLAPPVMGAGAFIMAEITGIPYSDIALAALLPCLLFYLACFISVDFQAVRLGIRGLPRKELPKFRELRSGLMLLLPLFVLLYLLIAGYSVIAAGTWGLAATLLVLATVELKLPPIFLAGPLALFVYLPTTGIAVNLAGLIATGAGAAMTVAIAMLTGRLALIPGMLKKMAGVVGWGLSETSRRSLQLIGVMACAGIIVGVLGLTGLGGRLSAIILAVAGDSQPIAFVLAMAIAIVLGMGMPTTAAYAIAAAVVAPALQRMGISPIAAHMFVFYCAVISAITPPVAIASFAAAALAGGNPIRTSFISMRLGIAAFILPFMFYTSPEILMTGSLALALQAFFFGVCAIVLLAAAGEGQLLGRLGPAERLLAVVSAVLLIADYPMSHIAGVAVAGGLLFWRMARRTKASPA
ncbi:MAG TPA: TRAP transporter fused permease subunit [Ferrovibrio sp.]|uniref:TRAP transporter permease n=1 Tax=Ferrovibrio sp. TaxID=1917215 RepID=UPI002ED1DE49